MSQRNQSEFPRLFLLACSLFLLASCSDSNDAPPPADVIDDGSDNGSGSDPGDPPGAPQGVLVVSGDGDSTEVQNTVSWALDPDATDYTVYWDNAPGVTADSSVVVPAAESPRHVVHSGTDVVAGADYYYRARANVADVGDTATQHHRKPAQRCRLERC